jgi:hypothetical protein
LLTISPFYGVNSSLCAVLEIFSLKNEMEEWDMW